VEPTRNQRGTNKERPLKEAGSAREECSWVSAMHDEEEEKRWWKDLTSKGGR
jgi:hypothetical protein